MRDEDLLTWSRRGYPPPLQQISDRVLPGWWPGLEVGRGWWPLLARLNRALAKIDPDYALTGVSSRDGALHFFASGTVEDIRIDDAVWTAIRASVRTCEICGKPGVRHLTDPHRPTVHCSAHAKPLSGKEVAFLRAAGSRADIAVVAQDASPADEFAASRAFAEVISRTHLSDVELASLLHVDVEMVHVMFASGALAGAERDGRVVYPLWQIGRAGRILPALARMLRAFPATYTSQAVRSVMLTPTEELCGESPRSWLEGGQALGVVSAYILSLNYTAG